MEVLLRKSKDSLLMSKKLSTEVNTKIANELTGEIAKINSHDAGYASEAQKILSMVNNVTTRLDGIEGAYHNDFGNVLSEFTSIKISPK